MVTRLGRFLLTYGLTLVLMIRPNRLFGALWILLVLMRLHRLCLVSYKHSLLPLIFKIAYRRRNSSLGHHVNDSAGNSPMFALPTPNG